MTALRVGIVCPYSLSMPGGVQGQVLGLARALREAGQMVRVLAPCDGPPPDVNVTPLGKSVPTASNGSVAPIAPDPACALRTIHALRNERFDVLHIHEPLVPGPSVTSLLVADVPVVATFHAAGARTHYGTVRWATRRLARKIAVRVAVSRDAEKLARDVLGGEYQVLYNGIETERCFDATPADKDKTTIFFLGRHDARKGLEHLVSAFELLGDDVALWVGGTGAQTAALKARTAHDPRIEWLGRLSEPEKLARMKAADVFCAPSTEGESFGIVLLEAMAAGTAVVASDIDGYRNVAGNGRYAMLFDPGSVESLRSRLELVCADESERGRIRRAGLERAEQFAMPGLAAEYIDIYRRLVDA